MTNHRPTTIALRTGLLADAMAIVEQDYASDLTVESVARRVASSPRQLQRAYKEIAGTTFRAHLTAVRMERARDLLLTSRLPVAEVARRVGYRQPAQFAKAFRRHHGASPSELRARARRGEVCPFPGG